MHADFPFRDPDLPLDARVDDLLGRLTLPEKISQLMNDNPPVDHLRLPGYNWWNEACHGVGRNGCATVFPQMIGLAASFDRDLLRTVGDAIASEARAKHHAATRAQSGNSHQYQGLTFWAPNINLYRDPRWGRGQETLGEDPVLTGELGTAFVRGLQGDHPTYLKVAACAKHFAVHSGPEAARHGFDSRVSIRDLRESYLPHFQQLVAAGVEAVMGAYNRVNGEPSCASITLQRILRQEWGFSGHYVSDCGAIDDFHRGHGVTAGPVESAALALTQGCDLNCGCTYNDLMEAWRRRLVSEADVDRGLRRVLRTKFRLGLFDPLDRVPWAGTPVSVVNSEKHRALARRCAVSSMVMLKNSGILPLTSAVRNLMVVGPGAASVDALLGNYFGLNPQLVTMLEGITARAPEGMRLNYNAACLPNDATVPPSPAAIYECACADVTIAVLGNLPVYEGEEGDAFASTHAGDRGSIELAESQRIFLERLRANKKPVILVLTGGGPIACPDAHDWCEAILHVWYPGCEGGHAVAQVLFGDVEPGGRLPVTVPRATNDLPPFENYALAGRTYRFATHAPLYPFGYGLGYTTWALSALRADSQTAVVTVRNTGTRAGRTVVQFYISPPSDTSGPAIQLVDFIALELGPGKAQEIACQLAAGTWSRHDDDGQLRRIPGRWRFQAAFAVPGQRSRELGVPEPLGVELVIA